ncbi:MAG: cell wall-active antibiotics response protein LiaF [Anaerolineales bacterium]
MKKQTQILIGGALIGFGILIMMSNLFDIDFGAICWPSFLILVGVLVIVRPRIAPPGTDVRMLLFGDLRRSGEWEVMDKEIWSFVGDVDLDFTQANFPEEEVTFQLYRFVGDVDLIVPEDIGISISSMGFVTEARLEGKKRGGFLTPIRYTSGNYESSVKKIHLEMISFVSDLKVIRV